MQAERLDKPNRAIMSMCETTEGTLPDTLHFPRAQCDSIYGNQPSIAEVIWSVVGNSPVSSFE